jgi:hypothetical protein
MRYIIVNFIYILLEDAGVGAHGLACDLPLSYTSSLHILLKLNPPAPFLFVVLGIEPKAWHLLGKHTTTEAHLQPASFFDLFNVAIRRVCITYAVCIVSIGKGWSHTGS